MRDCVFFISYHEPNAEINWEHLKSVMPKAKRVHGVRGFDAAYKLCAEQSKTPRFFTIDGDNQLLTTLDPMLYPEEFADSDYTFSWSALNAINGLRYGNGGVKNWSKNALATSATHEHGISTPSKIDFCFSLKYYQLNDTLSIANISHSPQQAFFAGFREGIKMGLINGNRPSSFNLKNLPADNLERLKIWCSVGADIENGLYSIVGARLGFIYLQDDSFDISQISDYEWLSRFFIENIQNKNISKMSEKLETQINQNFDLGITTLSPRDSIFLKSIYRNPTRNGLIR